MINQETYYQYGSQKIKVTSKQDVYEKIYLPAIIDTYKFINKSKGLENKIRDRIVWHLQNNHPFTAPLFQNEILDIIPERYEIISEEEQRRADICFHWSNFGRFIIECKRLFKQASKNEAYLNDGLIRFIKLKYARTNEYAGMIGFVVSGEIKSIFQKIVKDVEAFHPSNPKQAIITPINENWEYGFISFHLREDKKNIQIYHLLFNFTDNK